jgi:HK97 family phage prohead protease
VTAYQQALNLVMHRKLCEHEAGHAAMALTLGLDVVDARADYHEVTVEPADPDAPAGYVDIVHDPDRPRDYALAVLAGPLCEDAPGWPPRWPILAPITDDEAQLGRLAKTLDLDEPGWNRLVRDAYEITASRQFVRLHCALSTLFEEGRQVDRHTLRQVKAIAEERHMQHITFKAVTTTTTDQGVFEAVISTQSVDRENDVVVPEAMVEALKAWTFTGKMVPLHWNHSSDPEDIVGHVNPATVKAAGGEVVASGWIDQDTERGRHVWRLAKSGTLGFSFGYLIPEGGAVKRADGVREIRRLDVLEITATAAPMNNGTRVLNTKAATDPDPDRTPTQAELERELIRMGIITERANADHYQRADPALTGHGQNGHGETKHIDPRLHDEVKAINEAFDAATKALDADRKALANTDEPIHVAEFEC